MKKREGMIMEMLCECIEVQVKHFFFYIFIFYIFYIYKSIPLFRKGNTFIKLWRINKKKLPSWSSMWPKSRQREWFIVRCAISRSLMKRLLVSEKFFHCRFVRGLSFTLNQHLLLHSVECMKRRLWRQILWFISILRLVCFEV